MYNQVPEYMVFYCKGFTLQRMNNAYLITGGNMGRRSEQLAFAAKLIEERCGKIIDRSALYETAAWGKTDQDKFLNQALVLETRLNARDLLNEILYIENLMGRDRGKNTDRVLSTLISFFSITRSLRKEALLCRILK